MSEATKLAMIENALAASLERARAAREAARRNDNADLDDRLGGPIGVHIQQAVQELIAAWGGVNNLKREAQEEEG